MKKVYYDQQEYNQTKLHFRSALVFFFVALALLILIPLVTVFVQTRQTKFFFVVIGSILTIADFIAVLFIAFLYIRPYRALLKFLKDLDVHSQQEIAGVLQEISETTNVYLCNEFYALYFVSGGTRVRLYALESQLEDFEIGGRYRLTISQQIILSKEDIE